MSDTTQDLITWATTTTYENHRLRKRSISSLEDCTTLAPYQVIRFTRTKVKEAWTDLLWTKVRCEDKGCSVNGYLRHFPHTTILPNIDGFEDDTELKEMLLELSSLLDVIRLETHNMEAMASWQLKWREEGSDGED